MTDRYPDYEQILDWHAADGDDPGHSYFGQHDHPMRKPRVTPTSADPLHVSEPVFLGREVEYVNDCLERRWLTQGRYVGRLERGFAEFTQRRFGVACNSGTAALHLAMLSLGVQPGDVVIVPALSYIATANCVSYCGATPLFVDVDRATWCMDPADVRRKCERLKMATGQVPRGAIAVHLYDAIAELDAIRDALPDEAFLVEDAAQAHGGMYKERPAGSVGEVATFSFYASKTMAAGEGGMLVTDNDVTVEAARLFRGQGADRTGAYEHSAVGYNYRMTEISGALALAQLETVEEHLARRRHIIHRYRNVLDERLTFQRYYQGTVGGAWSMAVILPKGNPRTVVRDQLLVDHGIETRPFFVPLPYTKAYQAEHGQATCPVSIQLAHRGMNLPTHSGMTDADVDHVAEALREVIR